MEDIMSRHRGLNSRPMGHGEGVANLTSGFATLALVGNYAYKAADRPYIYGLSMIPVNDADEFWIGLVVRPQF